MIPEPKNRCRTVEWLREHAQYKEQSCLLWPFNRIRNGYGLLGYGGNTFYAHRYICELAHGEPPTPKHEAAHSCGKGHEGCVNPQHLSWKTASQNAFDSRAHRTQARNPFGQSGKLTKLQIVAIKLLRGKMTQEKLAELFDISQPTIRDIFSGRAHADVEI